MGYCPDDAKVRVDRFKPSGKWYDDRALDMTGFYDMSVYKAISAALAQEFPDYTFYTRPMAGAWYFVCLEPYNENSFPLLVWGVPNE